MHQYLVLDACAEGRAVALCDSDGKYHLVRATDDVPAVGVELVGADPGGFRHLLSARGGQVFGAFFERIDCGEKTARQHLRS
jgi:hypothetical protein